MICFFLLLRKLNFLRAEPADELAGLDGSEHGLPSAYADFMPAVDKYAEFGTGEHIVAVTGTVPPAARSCIIFGIRPVDSCQLSLRLKTNIMNPSMIKEDAHHDH